MKTKLLNKHNCGLGVAFFLSTLISANATAALPAGYTITDLGASVSPTAINDSGQLTANGPSGGFFRDSNGAINDFGSGSSGLSISVYGLNNHGHVVGSFSSEATEQISHAFVYKGSTLIDLVPEIPLYAGEAKGINDSGQIVGGIDFDFSAGNSPFFYDSASNTMNIISGVEASGNTGAFAINNSGQFVVNYIDNSGPITLFRSRLYEDSTTFTEIPQVPGAQIDEGVQGLAINNQGQVTGQSDILVGSTPIPHAFRFDGTNLIDLGAGIVGNGINDLDQIVGGSSAGAFLNDGSTTIDLNTLVASISGWTLQDAKDINNLGQIVGTGLLNGEQHGFLLTPTAVPIPSAIWLFGSALATFVGVGKRKQSV